MLTFLQHRVFVVRGPIILVPTAANRHPAVALYERGPEVETGLSIQVLTFSGGVVTSITGFVGDELFLTFGLPHHAVALKAPCVFTLLECRSWGAILGAKACSGWRSLPCGRRNSNSRA